VEYNERNLKIAEMYVEGLKADMGGTEIMEALQFVFRARKKGIPTQVFLLTDGEVEREEELFKMIEMEVQNAKEEEMMQHGHRYGGRGSGPVRDIGAGGRGAGGFVRVFTLGIGDNVSHDLVEGIARHSDGFAQFCTGEEKLTAKIIKMVKAAVLPPLSDYSIDWGMDLTASAGEASGRESKNEEKAITMFDEGLGGGMRGLVSGYDGDEFEYKVNDETFDVKRKIQTAPWNIPSIFPGARFTVCST
jgi:hypothetical protein